MTPLTLEYNGTEKWLGPDPAGGAAPSWGYSLPLLRLVSRAACTLTLRKAGGDPAAAADIPYGGQIILRKDRAYSAGFSGGRVIFKGSRTDLNGIASPGEPAVTMQFSDVWFNLTRQTFQHYWKARIGGSMVNFYYSRVNLFQYIAGGTATPWTYNNVQAQLTEIIAYASGPLTLPIQLGTVDPVWQLPVYGVKAITCAEAILLCLRSIPDAVTYFDYTTTPPTLHIRQRANLTAASLAWADGVNHQSATIKPRYDLVPASVVIQYQKTNQVNGVAYDTFTNDVYPALSTGVENQSLVIPIDLRGGVLTQVSGSVTSAAVTPIGTNDASDLIASDWWLAHKPDLKANIIRRLKRSDSSETDGITIIGGSLQVLDDDGTDLTSTWAANWPNEIIQPSAGVADWMYDGSTQIVAKHVTISAKAKYYKYDRKSGSTLITKLHSMTEHDIIARVHLTNSTAGTVNYAALQHNDPGDPAPSGLAQFIYTAASQLQWEGSHIIVEDSVSDIVVSTVHYLLSPRFTLNLTGGNAAWATMAAAIYETEIDFFHGKTTINFGPHAHLSAQEFFEMLMFFRTRVVFDNANIRSTGRNDAGANVKLTTDQQKENTIEGTPKADLHTVISGADGGDKTIVQHDALNGLSLIGKVDNTGALYDATTDPQIRAKLSDLTGTNKKAIFREVCVTVSGVTKKAWVLMTEPEAI